MNVTTGRSAGAKWLGSIQRTASTSVTKEMTVVLWDSTVVTAGSTAGRNGTPCSSWPHFTDLWANRAETDHSEVLAATESLVWAATTPCTQACHIEDAGHGAPVGWASLARDRSSVLRTLPSAVRGRMPPSWSRSGTFCRATPAAAKWWRTCSSVTWVPGRVTKNAQTR